MFATIKMGSTGADVTTAQAILVSLGYLPMSTAPGLFGPIMDGAVRAFQQMNKLAVDGIIGPNTWSALTGNSVYNAGGAWVTGQQGGSSRSEGSIYTSSGPDVSVAPAYAKPNTAGVMSFEPMDIVGHMPAQSLAQKWAALSTAKKALVVGGGLAVVALVFSGGKK